MSHVPRSSARVSAFLASTILVLATLGSSANAAPSSLQSAFSSAAAEFHVPASVLLAVSYTLTRWESSSGAGAFGPLQLADSTNGAFAGAKGDETARPLQTQQAGPTVAAAASASGASASAIRTDAKQNIRGGAALLARDATRPPTARPVWIADLFRRATSRTRAIPATTATTTSPRGLPMGSTSGSS